VNVNNKPTGQAGQPVNIREFFTLWTATNG
jgi:hypothetical protein